MKKVFILLAVIMLSVFGCIDPDLDADSMDSLSQSSGAGLKGEYFNNIDLTASALERVDASIDFDWKRGSPDSKIDTDTFSVRWTGFVQAKHSETYTFHTIGDDGIRLYVNDKLVVNDWSNHGPRERSGTIALKAGQHYPIKLEYYENTGGAVAKLLWSSPSQAKQIIPATQLKTQLVNDNESKNIAVGKPTSQSSTAYRGDSARAVDGNTSGRYGDNSVTHTAHESAPWWRVELGGAHDIEKTVIFNRTDCCDDRLSNFHVDYLDASGKVLATRTHAGKAAVQTALDLKAQGVFAVRVQLHGTNPLSLAEVQVFGASGGIVDQCPFDPNKTEPGQCGCGVPEGTCSGGGFFSVGILPDVQKVTLSDENAEWLYKTGDFFKQYKEEYNLLTVASVGDLVQVATLPGTRNQTRWDRVLKFAHDLKGKGIPFIPACGNHDGCQPNYGSPLDYSAQFSDLVRENGPTGNPSAYVLKRDNPFFKGSYSTTNATHGVENAYYRFEYGGRAFIVLSLRFGSGSELNTIWKNWASGVLKANADAKAIIITHWLQDSAAWLDSSNPVLCEHKNVLMAVVGHSHGTRFRNVIECGGGHNVEWYQFSLPHGTEQLNEAAARIYTFDLDLGQVCFKTRHIFHNKWLTEKAGCDTTCTLGSACHCDEACFDLP